MDRNTMIAVIAICTTIIVAALILGYFMSQPQVVVQTPCGNSLCDVFDFENCQTCPSDCVCNANQECAPDNPNSDNKGCYTPEPPSRPANPYPEHPGDYEDYGYGY